MKVAIIARSTLHSVKGGDTYQVIRTAGELKKTGITVDIRLTNELIDYDQYDLLHFFNIVRPADILYHIHKTNKPFVVTPILVDYSEFDKYHRRGMAGIIFRLLSAGSIEYTKTIARWLLGKDALKSKSYLWKGQHQSIKEILIKAALILPNSFMEYQRLVEQFKDLPPYMIVPNGIDPGIFNYDPKAIKDPRLVICAGRIEGIKNQMTLIRALNNTKYTLVIIGSASPNQQSYYQTCKREAGENVSFIDHLPQEELVKWYAKAKVHILPSWFETCGLSTLEAASMGCNVVITDRGYTREYFEDYGVYCDPSNPQSIFDAIEKASSVEYSDGLRQKILNRYTWQQAGEITMQAYKLVVS